MPWLLASIALPLTCSLGWLCPLFAQDLAPPPAGGAGDGDPTLAPAATLMGVGTRREGLRPPRRWELWIGHSRPTRKTVRGEHHRHPGASDKRTGAGQLIPGVVEYLGGNRPDRPCDAYSLSDVRSYALSPADRPPGYGCTHRGRACRRRRRCRTCAPRHGSLASPRSFPG